MINSLYVHIPFCAQKCLYCDFNSYTCLDLQEDYLKALKKELSFIKQKKFKTLFVGGGTPSILTDNHIKTLLQILREYEAEEYTFECNPGTLTMEKLNYMKYYGVNRLSIGLQSTDNRLLKRLGRIHDYNSFLISFENARKAGFTNINIDLMFGIPDQTLSDFSLTLDNVIALNPEHISCYSLIVEEGTPFYDLENKGKLELCDEETERSMYYHAIKKITNNNYDHYEISNFSKPGFECRHNITYWEDGEYYGAGAGAHSYVNGVRYSNYSRITDYMNHVNEITPVEISNRVSTEDELSEFMFLGLRMTKGISKREFKLRFNSDIYDVYRNELLQLINNGLLIDNGDSIFLTSRGIDISNQVFIYFMK